LLIALPHAPGKGVTSTPVVEITLGPGVFRILYARRSTTSNSLVVAVYMDYDERVYKNTQLGSATIIASSNRIPVIRNDQISMDSHAGPKHKVMEWILPMTNHKSLAEIKTVDFEFQFQLGTKKKLTTVSFKRIPVTTVNEQPQ
jgi:hypothetical protein